MKSSAHPCLLIDAFVKEAADALRPAGMSDATRRMKQRDVSKERQEYSQPVPSVAVPRTDIAATQKSITPPPVT